MAPHFRSAEADDDEIPGAASISGGDPPSIEDLTDGTAVKPAEPSRPDNSPVPLRKNFSYQLLWLGSAFSSLGTGASSIAFPLLILGMTGSSALAGISAASSTAAMVIAGLPAGALADRWDRRRVLISVESLRVINGLALVAAIFGDWTTLGHIIIAAVVQGAGGALLMPCRNAAIRDIVHRDQLHSAFAQEEARSHIADVGGPPVGAATFGIARFLPFLIDALSYLVSLVCIIGAKIPRGNPRGRIYHRPPCEWTSARASHTSGGTSPSAH